MFNIYQIQKFQEEIKSLEEPIIVEGKKDKKQLVFFGFKNILDISGKPLHSIVDKIKSQNHQKVVILTDFDNEGEKKAENLTKLFTSQGIKINSSIRNKIKSIFKIHQIEELHYFTKFMEVGGHGKVSSIYNKIFNRSRVHIRRDRRKT